MGKIYNEQTERWDDDLVFKPDLVNNPKHYKNGGIETIDLIKTFLTPEEWRGYLKGTIYAYRDRAPYKGQTESDYAKAKWYYDRLTGGE